jgi:hypothetical protein
MSKLLATAVLGLSFAQSAAAAEVQHPNATLTSFEGKVSVNQGKEFVRARSEMRLKPGDRVMVQKGSEVVLTFDDECRLDIEENKLVTIPDVSTCAGAVLVQQGLQPSGGAAIGSTGTGKGGVWLMVGIVAAIDIWWLNEDEEFVSP